MLAACVSLGACRLPHLGGDAPKEPSGQVVAVVDGREVTLRELRAELTGVSFPNAQARKFAERAALQAIIRRRLVAMAAHDQGLDKTPDFALSKQRAMDILLAETMQAKLEANHARWAAAHP